MLVLTFESGEECSGDALKDAHELEDNDKKEPSGPSEGWYEDLVIEEEQTDAFNRVDEAHGLEEVKKWDLHALTKRLFLFFFPFFLATVFVLGLYTIFEWPEFTVVGGGIFAYFFPPLGKETIIPVVVNTLTQKHDFTPLAAILSAAISIALVDIIVGLFLMWNFDLALKIPLIGPAIKMMETKGGAYLKKKAGIRKAAFVGVALFVIFPFQGSGGVGGTILGRLIGLKKERVWYAISLGAVFGCLMIAVIGHYVGDAMLKTFGSTTFQIIGVAILIGIIIWAAYKFWYHKRNGERKGIHVE